MNNLYLIDMRQFLYMNQNVLAYNTCINYMAITLSIPFPKGLTRLFTVTREHYHRQKWQYSNSMGMCVEKGVRRSQALESLSSHPWVASVCFASRSETIILRAYETPLYQGAPNFFMVGAGSIGMLQLHEQSQWPETPRLYQANHLIHPVPRQVTDSCFQTSFIFF